MLSLLLSIPIAFTSSQQSLRSLVDDTHYVNRLHGISAVVPKGWSAKVLNNLFIISDNTHFVVLRTARYDGKLKTVAQKWLEEHRIIGSMQKTSPRFAFKESPQGIIIIGEGLNFPHQLSPMSAINAGLLGIQLPQNYQEATVFLPGEKVVLILSCYFPATTNSSTRKQILDIIRSLQFVDPKERIAWREHSVTDPETGELAFRIHVPTEAEFKGAVIPNAGLGTQRQLIFSIRFHEFTFRLDQFGLQTYIIQSPYGTQANCMLNINGAVSQQPQPLIVDSPENAERLILGVWQSATQTQWSITESIQLPKSKEEQLLEEQGRQDALQAAYGFRTQAEFSMPKRAFLAKGPGQKVRIASWKGTIMNATQPDPLASTQHLTFVAQVFTAECPEVNLKPAMQMFASIMSSLQISPQWSLSALQRFTRENQQINQMVRDMLSEHREFNSRMSTMWTNALSDQTYVKDPQTNEIFKVHKKVWETGEFWREPIFGGMLGGVERESKLEELLKMEGWRQLHQSLEGFPETWKG